MRWTVLVLVCASFLPSSSPCILLISSCFCIFFGFALLIVGVQFVVISLTLHPTLLIIVPGFCPDIMMTMPALLGVLSDNYVATLCAYTPCLSRLYIDDRLRKHNSAWPSAVPAILSRALAYNDPLPVADVQCTYK